MVEVRRLGPGDRSAALDIVSALAGPASDELVSEEHLAGFLANDDNILVGAWLSGEPIGFLVAYRLPRLASGSMVYLYDIFVEPARRRRGAATEMVELLKSICRDTGIRQLWVGSDRSNRAACRLWLKTGGERVSEDYVEFIYSFRRPG